MKEESKKNTLRKYLHILGNIDRIKNNKQKYV